MRRSHHDEVVGILREQIEQRDRRISELEDRLASSSLAEFHATRAMAMPVPGAAEDTEYMSDPTGLFRVAVDPER